MPQEASDAIAYGPVKEGIGIRRFDNAALVHEYHLVGDMARKTHLMGDDHHCRAAFCEPDDDVQHLLDRLRIESRGRFVEQKGARSEEHTSELQSLMRHSYAVFCLKKKKTK